MTECPICKERPGTYYKCFTGALSKLLGRYPEIVEASELWVLLAPDRLITDEREFADIYCQPGINYYRRGREKVPFIAVSIRDDKPDRMVYKYPLVPYNTFDAFEKVQNEQERFLIFLCPTCANRALDELELEPFELWQLFACECRCCGYYTLGGQAWQKLCLVCSWDDWEGFDLDTVSGDNGITLREARENYARQGTAKDNLSDWVRPPRLEEHPRFYRYFG